MEGWHPPSPWGCPPPSLGAYRDVKVGTLPLFSLRAGREVKGAMGTMPLISLGAGRDVKGAMGTMPLISLGAGRDVPYVSGDGCLFPCLTHAASVFP